MAIEMEIEMERRHEGHDHGGGMGSMNMGSGVPSLFYMQQMYWAVVGAVIAAATLVHIANLLIAAHRFSDSTTPSPSKPKSIFLTTFATCTAITRELSHFTPGHVEIAQNLPVRIPPLGRLSLVLANLIVLLVLCFYKLDTTDQWSWENIGYRTGFMSIAQLPLIFLLAGKTSIVGLLTGSSYERLNWYHRWVSRTLWLTVTIHMCFWFRSWGRYNYITTKLTTDVTVQRGFSAWCILTFTMLASTRPVRRMSHELFFVSHILTMVGLLVAVWFHAPEEVKVWVWIPIGLVVFDRLCRSLYLVFNNLSIFHPTASKNSAGKQSLWAHTASFTPLPGNVTRITVPEPVLSWKPGQHAFLSCHGLLPLQSHPFSISSLPSDGKLEFLVRAEKGGTRKLFSYASKSHTPLGTTGDRSSDSRRVTIDGPYGRMRNPKQFNSLVLVAGGMGATFTMPLMRDTIADWKKSCQGPKSETSSLLQPRSRVKRIHHIWVIRARSHLTWFAEQMEQVARDFESCHQTNPEFDKQLDISIYITCDTELAPDPIVIIPQQPQQQQIQQQPASHPNTSSPAIDTKPSVEVEEKDSIESASDQKQPSSTPSTSNQATHCLPQGGCCCTTTVSDPDKPTPPCTCSGPAPAAEPPKELSSSSSSEKHPSSSSSPNYTRTLTGRPHVRNLIRSTLEKAEGESAVLVCGPQGLNDDARRSVVGLSDERAVHKGTGAQGIYLHVEQFGF